MLALLARLQGGYYLITGIWPVVAPESFQFLTGRKVDFWLAQTVGILLAITGGLLLRAARRAEFPVEMAQLAGLQAATLGAMDLWSITQPNVTRLYLLDAVVEFLLIGAWIWAWRKRK